MKAPLLCVLLAVLLISSGCRAPQNPALNAPPPAVVTALQRGINLGMWTGDSNLDELHAAQVHPDGKDLQLIRSLGFRHVRLTFDLDWLADESLKIRKARLAEMRQDLRRLAAENLFVVLSMQPTVEFKRQLGSNEKLLSTTAVLWRELTSELKDFGPNQIAYELLNEPEITDPQQLHRVLEVLVAAARRSAPAHTLIVQGPHFGDLEDLVKMSPLTDRNLVYSFHFYEPKNFTHQGVPYGWPMWGLMRGLPYPSSPEGVAPALDFMTFEAIEHARWYGEQRWDRAKLDGLLAAGSAWAQKHSVTLWCSEFGVYRYAVKPEDRAAWLTDIHELLEARRIGWSLWDYSGYFGLVSGPQGRRVLDREAAGALKLTAVPAEK